jgi:cell shape-determining protein MreD
MIASFLQGPLVRIIPVGIVMLALQRTFLVDVQVAGVIIQLMTATAAAAGVAGGSERGAMVGFVFGIMFDLAEGTPLGSTAAAMTVAGIVGGLLALIAADPQWWLGAIFTALGTAAGVAMIPVVRIFVGESEPFQERLRVVLPVVAVAGAVMSPLLVPLARWCLKLKRPEWTQPIKQASPDE